MRWLFKWYLNKKLIKAGRKGDAVTVNSLLSRGADINAKDNYGNVVLSILIVAIKGNTKLAKIIIDHGADVNAKDINGETALTCAVNKGSTKLVNILIKHGAECIGIPPERLSAIRDYLTSHLPLLGVT